MQAKTLGVLGLILMGVCHLLLNQGPEFLYQQSPIDFAHWCMLLAAACLFAVNYVFPRSIIGTIAVVLTTIGVLAHIGMSTIDFTLWSFGEDWESRDTLIKHLMGEPSIWLPFFVIGPACLYAGLATHAWKFMGSHPILAIVTILGSAVLGLGQMLWQDRTVVLLGYLIFALGLGLLMYRGQLPGHQNRLHS